MVNAILNNQYVLGHSPFHPEFKRKVSVGFSLWRRDIPTAFLVTYLPLTPADTEVENYYDLAQLPLPFCKIDGRDVPLKNVIPERAINTLKDYSTWVGAFCNSLGSIIYDVEEKKYYVGGDIHNMTNQYLYRQPGNGWLAFSRLEDLENYALRKGHYAVGTDEDNSDQVGYLCPCCGHRFYWHFAKPMPLIEKKGDNVLSPFYGGGNSWRVTPVYDPKIEKYCPQCRALNKRWNLYKRIFKDHGSDSGIIDDRALAIYRNGDRCNIDGFRYYPKT